MVVTVSENIVASNLRFLFLTKKICLFTFFFVVEKMYIPQMGCLKIKMYGGDRKKKKKTAPRWDVFQKKIKKNKVSSIFYMFFHKFKNRKYILNDKKQYIFM